MVGLVIMSKGVACETEIPQGLYVTRMSGCWPCQPLQAHTARDDLSLVENEVASGQSRMVPIVQQGLASWVCYSSPL